MDTTNKILCPFCGKSVPSDIFFCPYCGAKLKTPPINTSLGKQIVIYIVSFVLAPFGFGYAIKYLRQADPKAQRIGMISLALTIIAVGLMIWISKAFTDYYYGMINQLSM